MWVSRKNEPVKISYGHDGSALYMPTINTEEPWLFARSRGKGYRFYDRSYRHTLISPNPSLTEDLDPGNSGNTVATTSIYRQLLETATEASIGERMFRRLAHESANLLSPKAYDPVHGSTLASGYLDDPQSSAYNDIFGSEIVDEYTGLAYLDNSSDSILRVSQLEYSERSVYDETEEKGVVRVPSLGNTATLDLVSQIKQVQLAEREPSICPYVLVRTGFGTSLVEHRIENDKLRLQECFKIPQNTGKSLQVHSQFSQWSWADVGVINENSKWKIWSIRPDSGELVATYASKSIKSRENGAKSKPTSSIWHRLKWGADANTVVTGSRCGVYLNDIRVSPHENNNKSSVLSFLEGQRKPSFEVRDFQMAPGMPNKLIALTSADLHLLDLRMMTSKPLLSWEHRLAAGDPSLSFTTTHINDISLVSVSSLTMPASVVYQFGELDGLPISAEDPFYLLKYPLSIIKSQVQIPLRFQPLGFNEDSQRPQFVASFELSRDHGLFRNVLPSQDSVDIEDPLLGSRESSEDPSQELQMSAERDEERIGAPLSSTQSDSEDAYCYDKPLALSKFADSFIYDFRYLYKRFFDIDQQLPPAATETYLDEYALKLANIIRHQAESLKANVDVEKPKRVYIRRVKPILPTKRTVLTTLGELLEPDYLLSNPLEAASMIKQLGQHFEGTEIAVQAMAADLNMFLGQDAPLDSIDKVYEKLAFLYIDSLGDDIAQELREQKERLCRYIAIDVALACIAVQVRPLKQARNSSIDHINQYSTSEMTSFRAKPNTRVLAADWQLHKPLSIYRWEPFDEDSHLEALSRIMKAQVDQDLDEATIVRTTDRGLSSSAPEVAIDSTPTFKRTRSMAIDKHMGVSTMPTPARKRKRGTREGFV